MIAMRERIERNVTMVPFCGCWLWTGNVSDDGYGRLSITLGRKDGKRLQRYVRAHRAAFEAFVGPIPDGAILLHECDVTLCVNPEHLTPGTQQDNLADMRAKGRERGACATHREKTHCNNGHPLSGDNLRIEGKIKARRCRTCERDRKLQERKEGKR